MRLCQMYNGLISYICSMYEKNPEEETFKTFFLKYHDVLVLYAASILKISGITSKNGKNDAK